MVVVYQNYTRIKNKLFSLVVRGSFAKFGRKSTIETPIRLVGSKYIEVGNRVYIGSDSWIEANLEEPGKNKTIIEIQDGVSISGHCTITANQRVVLEKNVLIARYCYISDHSHAFTNKELPIKEQGVDKVSPVVVSQGAWLGQNVVVCPGVRIGRNSVIGANSVVTKDVPDYQVAAGSPAKIIRSI